MSVRLQRRAERLVERVVYREVTVEAGHLECAPRLEPRSREQERTPVWHPRARFDQDAERGRVDELDGAEVDHEPLGSLRAALEQRFSDDVRVVEVELPRERHDHGLAVAFDSRDRILTCPLGSVERRAVTWRHLGLLGLDAVYGQRGLGCSFPRQQLNHRAPTWRNSWTL